MRIAVICDQGEEALGKALVDALDARGAAASLLEVGPPPESGPTAELAHHLTGIEAQLEASPLAAVALIGRGDRPFAGVLVATKARVPAFRLAGPKAGEDGIDNGPLIDRLADHAVASDADAAAEAITAALRAS